MRMIKLNIENKLTIYKNLLLKWAPKLNLVADSTLGVIEQRHFEDSSQLLPFVKPSDKIIDVGSGAGFPGAILAIYGHDVTLLESDQKKCVFLENVSRETHTNIDIVCSRIEEYFPKHPINIITARGLAPLERLVDLTSHLASPGKTRGLFLSGASKASQIAPHSLLHRLKRTIKSKTNKHSMVLEYQY